MEETSHKLKDYINEISAIQEENPFDLRALQSCINSYDFTDDDKDKLSQIASGHSKRSEEMLRQGKIEGAIVSMERAVEIYPLSSEFRNRLAQLYVTNSEKEKALENARFSLLVERNNPIAKSILKDIKKDDDKQSGKDQYKKLLIPFSALIILIIFALLSRNSFDIPFLRVIEGEEEQTQAQANPLPKPVEFTERQVVTEAFGLPEEVDISIETSTIAKTNGSFSYTLQATLQSESELISSADLNILFRDYKGKIIFRKVLPLLSAFQNLYPGETLLIDEFFYIHYLPPDIAAIDIKLTDLKVADEIPQSDEPFPLKIEWSEDRPEGTKLEMAIKNRSALTGYSEGYTNLKLQLHNLGFSPVETLHVDLQWRDVYGNVFFSISRELIEPGSPPLKNGENRLFHIFTDLPSYDEDEEIEIFINVNRINL